jgi:pyocin large subunit-like protein
MNRRTVVTAIVVAMALAASVFLPRLREHHEPPRVPPAIAAFVSPARETTATSAVGFRSRERLEEHYRKHGNEFGDVTEEQYLHLAQELRDRPAGNLVLEGRSPEGHILRYDKASGAFLACDPNGTIRTFFRPRQGERYFRSQIMRER